LHVLKHQLIILSVICRKWWKRQTWISYSHNVLRKRPCSHRPLLVRLVGWSSRFLDNAYYRLLYLRMSITLYSC
jgi:hypothetical protein